MLKYFVGGLVGLLAGIGVMTTAHSNAAEKQGGGLVAAGNWSQPFLVKDAGKQAHFLLSVNDKIYLVRFTADNADGQRVEILESNDATP